MEQQDSIGTVDQPAGATIVRLVPGSEPIDLSPSGDISERHRAAEVKQSEPQWMNDLLNEIEDMIQRYPWPALILGVGAGYLLARRVR